MQGDPKNPIFYLLHHGAAVLLWPRRTCDSKALERQLRTSFKAKKLATLPQVMHAVRKASAPDSPCREMTLLWDDFDRLPDYARGDDDERFALGSGGMR